ncbi:50S ribosomal protein L17 [Microgenomates group bacterium RBG_19FT_COMBO_39_10]|nr:MAG: 50S ribosomal protein L17 [Microgenomates group bacterium RBG_19FT_COMBO_39_10]
MKHRVTKKKLSRKRSHRRALFKNLLSALILHGEIKTTESKAKAVRRLFDRLVTKGKKNTLHTRRTIEAFLNNRKVVNKLVDNITPQFKDRSSGFTRIIRLGQRRGDDATMVKLELVAKPKSEEKSGKEKPKKSNKKKKDLVRGKNEKNKDNQSK